jgi:hypothetical protein
MWSFLFVLNITLRSSYMLSGWNKMDDLSLTTNLVCTWWGSFNKLAKLKRKVNFLWVEKKSIKRKTFYFLVHQISTSNITSEWFVLFSYSTWVDLKIVESFAAIFHKAYEVRDFRDIVEFLFSHLKIFKRGRRYMLKVQSISCWVCEFV